VPIPSDMDSDPNAARISYEVVIRVNPDTPFAAGAGPTIASQVQARTGITPRSVTVDASGVATIVVPDTSVDVGFWVGWVASAMAAAGRPGLVTAIGNRARIT
jgi:hypothetical protein